LEVGFERNAIDSGKGVGTAVGGAHELIGSQIELFDMSVLLNREMPDGFRGDVALSPASLAARDGVLMTREGKT
jgi:hypothetical protein